MTLNVGIYIFTTQKCTYRYLRLSVILQDIHQLVNAFILTPFIQIYCKTFNRQPDYSNK